MMQKILNRNADNKTARIIKIVNARSPTLETVGMVEETISRDSGKYNQREIWGKLAKKVMWQTYKVIINYLQDINKIIIDKNDKIIYIWNPKLAEKYQKRRKL